MVRWDTPEPNARGDHVRPRWCRLRSLNRESPGLAGGSVNWATCELLRAICCIICMGFPPPRMTFINCMIGLFIIGGIILLHRLSSRLFQPINLGLQLVYHILKNLQILEACKGRPLLLLLIFRNRH